MNEKTIKMIEELGDNFYCVCRALSKTKSGFEGFWAGDGKGLSFNGETPETAIEKLYNHFTHV